MTDAFRFNEKYLSQIPALQLLLNLGFTYLTPQEALKARGGKLGNVLLEDILRSQLKKLNRIHFKGGSYLFSEENLQTAIQRLKNVKWDGLQRTNEAVYDLITLGTSLEQSIEGDQKSFTLRYIDWRHPENNVYHVAAEFSVERTRSHELVRPDLVLFVNGIPFAVIECKSPAEELETGVVQMIRNQRDNFIPRLFAYVQTVLAVNKNGVSYATVGTPKKFWATWKEAIPEAVLSPLVEKPLPESVKASVFDLVCQSLGVREDITPYLAEREITEQDRVLYALCRPERLLAMAFAFTVFDGGLRKIARYQQFFAVLKIMARVKERDEAGRRRGGVVWHTQGSGKSLTMVMLARALALDEDIPNPRIVLVTDRLDLDTQLGNTFLACGLKPVRAVSGKHLLSLMCDRKAHVITTLVHKFDRALSAWKDFQDDSTELFVLVDESHRTHYGPLAATMRRVFPKACYLGFTGTPLMKGEKRNSFAKFGGLIDAYTIKQAVEDKAVVPLLYEARLVEMEQNKAAIDLWFERHTNGLTEAQKADLKKKYSRAEMLSKTDQVIYMEAFDISEHYREHWQGTGFKAQLVARSKAAALKFKTYLDDIGYVSSEIIISPPDEREGYEEVDSDEAEDKVAAFWARMMERYGSEENYNQQIVNRFKFGDEPEILIVVDKLLTGFDAPRNTVLYLTRLLREHTLLQAIARVNRLFDDEQGNRSKEFGYIIDYRGVLGELDKALTAYSELEGFEETDLQGALTSIQEEVQRLPQRHADLWDLFKEVKNRKDEEGFELLLRDEKLRVDFYERLSVYTKTLGIALSSETFLAEISEAKLRAYKQDLKRFQNLKGSVQLRYAESVDYRDFEPKIQKLLDTHISASEVIRLNEPVNIFDGQALKQVLEDQGLGQSTAAKADTIAHATKRAIHEHLDQDPAFFQKFSKLIQDAIDAFRAQRISDLEYLNKALEIRDAVVNRRVDNLPAGLQDNDDAAALFGLLKPILEPHVEDSAQGDELTVKTAIHLVRILKQHGKVNYWSDPDAQKSTKNAIDDFLFVELREAHGIPLTPEEMDEIIEKTMTLARHRLMV